MAQKPAKTDEKRRLDPLQLQAIEILMSGETITETCRRVGIDRSTYYDWVKNDSVFVAGLNRAKADLWNSFRGRLNLMTDKAVNAIGDALDNVEDPKTRLQAALAILKANGMLDPAGVRIGFTDPADIERERRNLELINLF